MFASYSSEDSRWLIPVVNLFGDNPEYRGSWPKYGYLNRGKAYRHRRLVLFHRKSKWPTPMASVAGKTKYALYKALTGKFHMTLDRAIFLAENMTSENAGNLSPNPEFLEWMMGFPFGWTR